MRAQAIRSALVALSVPFAAVACDRSHSESSPRPEDTPPPPQAVQPETHSAQLNPPGTSKAKLPEVKDPLKEADGDMKKVLVELDALGARPINTLPPDEARKQPTLADAMKALLQKEGKSTAPIEMSKVENRKIPGGGGTIDARIYTPKSSDKKPYPVVAYWHGGGFVLGGLDTYDASARAIAKEANAIVVALDYRRAPEAKFPAAHDDAFAGYQWVVTNAASFGGDPKRIAVAGESAGGNLAANVAIAARDRGAAVPVHELLVYPVAGTNMSTDSYREWDNAKPLTKGMMTWFFDNYTRSPDDAKDPRMDLVDAKLQSLPKTTIILAEIDPLRSDGELLAKRLDAAGVSVDKKVYEGVTHEFFGLGAVVADAKSAESYAGDRLKDSFKQ